MTGTAALGPLDGLRVIDATWGMPGQIATMLLGDYGATVVKVERPGGAPDAQSVNRRSLDRGKLSVELDLKNGGDAHVRALVANADVFVESFCPGSAAKYGLDYATTSAANPALVHCSISAYGQSGPWADRAGYDALVAARIGMMAEQPGHRAPPIFLGHPSVSYVTALLAAIGILSAQRVRRETGTGQQVDVSLLDGVLGQTALNWWWNDRGLSYLGEASGDMRFGRQRLITDLFECQDGEYIVMHTGGEGSFKKTMDALDLGGGVEEIRGQLEMSVPLTDDEIAAVRRVRDVFRTRPRTEWLKLFDEIDTAAYPVLRPGEVLSDAQVEHAGVVVELPDDEYGSLRQVGPVIRFAGSPASTPTPAPKIGEHNSQLTQLLEPSPPAAAGVHDSAVRVEPLPHALAGIRVVDFSAFFATAYGSRFFSDLGADVIKVESVSGDPMRPLPEPFEGCQRGKRTIALDLKSPDGRAIAHDLVRNADIVVHNLRPGKAERLGIGYDELRKIKPDLIYGYSSGFGSTGPRANDKSFAPLLSGFTGLLYEAAGHGNPPVTRARASEDYYGGLLSACAMLMALDHRGKTGEGQYYECPQFHASLFATTEQCLEPSGKVVTEYELDAEQMGYHALYRLYRTSDGFVCIACVHDREFRALCDVLGLGDLGGMPSADAAASGGQLADRIERALARLSTAQAFEDLDRAGVPVEIAPSEPGMPEFFWNEWAFETGRVFEHYHATWGWIREVGDVVRLSATPGPSKGPSPLLGEHTVAILSELGYTEPRIAELVEQGVCRVP